MSERLLTSDVPAIPDPEYVYVNPDRKRDIVDRALDDPDEELPLNIRYLFENMAELKAAKETKPYDYYVEDVFELSGAQNFIKTCAAYDDDGRLNMDLTSVKLGIPYNYNMNDSFAHGEITGLPGTVSFGEPLEIHLNPENRLHQVTFGHEVAHYFWQKFLCRPREGRLEENFCEYFGRRMAIPLEHLDDYDEIDESAILDIMSRFRSELGDTITALMEYGMLPPRVAIDSYNGRYPNKDYSEKVNRGIFCLHCTQVGGDYGCPNTDQPTPLFDFTDRAWGGRLQHCLGEDLHNPEIMSTLTKYYVANEVQYVLFRHGALYEDEPDSV